MSNLLFRNNFGTGVTLQTPTVPVTQEMKFARQGFTGTCSETGVAWPASIYNSDFVGINMITTDSITAQTLSNYATNTLVTETEAIDGATVRALQSSILSKAAVGTWDAQSPFIIERPIDQGDIGDLYFSYWFKHPEGLTSRLDTDTPGGQAIVQTQFKTGGYNGTWTGDYRISTNIQKQAGTNNLYWFTKADNVANSGFTEQVYWSETNYDVHVPIEEWFHYEVFIRRSSGDDGRFWSAIDGQVIVDRNGPNMGALSLPVNRIMLTSNYTGGAAPVTSMMTRLEIWDGFPCGEGIPCHPNMSIFDNDGAMEFWRSKGFIGSYNDRQQAYLRALYSDTNLPLATLLSLYRKQNGDLLI